MLLNVSTVSPLEHFSTAKLVMMTSQTPNGLRSAAVNDVSNCAFTLPYWHIFLLLTSERLGLSVSLFFRILYTNTPFYCAIVLLCCGTVSHHYDLRKVFVMGPI